MLLRLRVRGVATPHTFNLCRYQYSLDHHNEREYYRRLLRGYGSYQREQSHEAKNQPKRQAVGNKSG